MLSSKRLNPLQTLCKLSMRSVTRTRRILAFLSSFHQYKTSALVRGLSLAGTRRAPIVASHRLVLVARPIILCDEAIGHDPLHQTLNPRQSGPASQHDKGYPGASALRDKRGGT